MASEERNNSETGCNSEIPDSDVSAAASTDEDAGKTEEVNPLIQAVRIRYPIGIPLPGGGLEIPNRVFIGGLSSETSELELELFFCQFGEVRDTRVVTDRKTGDSKGYGFVTFEEVECAVDVLKKKTILMKGRKLRLRKAVRKNGGQFAPSAASADSDPAEQAYSPPRQLHPIVVSGDKPRMESMVTNSSVPLHQVSSQPSIHLATPVYPYTAPELPAEQSFTSATLSAPHAAVVNVLPMQPQQYLEAEQPRQSWETVYMQEAGSSAIPYGAHYLVAGQVLPSYQEEAAVYPVAQQPALIHLSSGSQVSMPCQACYLGARPQRGQGVIYQATINAQFNRSY